MAEPPQADPESPLKAAEAVVAHSDDEVEYLINFAASAGLR